MRKNFLLLMLLALLPFAGFAQTSSDIFTITLAGNDATITGFAADVTTSEVVTLAIPSTLPNGTDPSKPYKVVKIADNAFQGGINNTLKGEVTSITIANDNVATIGENAFAGFSKLTSVTIGNTVAAIGARAFANCPLLETVNFGSKVKTIGAGAFAGTNKIKTLDLSTTVVVKVENLFGTTYKYAAVNYTQDAADAYNAALAAGLPIDKTTVVTDAKANTYFTSLGGVYVTIDAEAVFNQDQADAYNATLENALPTAAGTIPADWADANLTAFNTANGTVLDKGDDYTTAQAKAYNATLTGHFTATTVRNAANVFKYNAAVGNVAVNAIEANGKITTDDHILLAKVYNNTLAGKKTTADPNPASAVATAISNNVLETVVLPATWEKIGADPVVGQNIVGAFENCTKLKTVTFTAPAKNDQVQAINPKAFLGTIIEDLNLENTHITSIPSDLIVGTVDSGDGNAALVNSTLKTVEFPVSLVTINDKAFYQCALLSTVTFPTNSTLANIGNYVFGVTPSLESINFSTCYKLSGFQNAGVATTPFIREDGPQNNTELKAIVLPAWDEDKVGAVKFAKINLGLANLVALSSITNLAVNIDYVEAGAFENDAKLTELTFNKEVGTIEAGAFEGCTKLATLSINGITNILGAVFTTANTTLTTLKITGDVTGTINAAAFANCSAITSLEIAKGKEYKPGTVNAAAFTVAEGATIEMGQLTSNPSGLITALGDVTKLTLGAINGNLAAGTAIVTGANIAEVTVGEIKAGKGFRADVLGQAEKITFAAINNALTATTTANDALKEIVFNGVIRDVADMIPAVSFDQVKAANLEKVTYTGTPENKVFNIAAFGTIAKAAASEVEFTTSTEIAELYGVAPTNLYRVFWKADPVEETIAVAGPGTYKYGKFFVPAGQTYEIAKDQDGAKVVVYEAYADKQGENVIYVNQLRIIDGKFFILGTNANLDQNGTAVIVKSDSEAPVIAKKTLENKNSLNYTVAGLPVNEIVCQETSILGSLLKTKDLTDGTHNSDFALYAMMKPATNGLAWKQFKSSNTMPAQTFYVRGDASVAASELKVVFTDGSMDDVTAIKDINAAEQNNGEIFNLQGIRVNGAQKGIFIQNGKKVVIK